MGNLPQPPFCNNRRIFLAIALHYKFTSIEQHTAKAQSTLGKGKG